METKISSQQQLLEERSPGFAEMEKNYEDTTKSYENIKKEIVGTNSYTYIISVINRGQLYTVVGWFLGLYFQERRIKDLV